MFLFIVKRKFIKYLNFLAPYFVFLEFTKKFPITAPINHVSCLLLNELTAFDHENIKLEKFKVSLRNHQPKTVDAMKM